MTILIKGMEMPKNCYECFCHKQVKAGVDHPAFDYCVLENWGESCTPLTMTVAEAKEGIVDSCPLIKVPTPHGRLIDADAFDSIKYEIPTTLSQRYEQGFHDGVNYVQHLIIDAPTVIEAEK